MSRKNRILLSLFAASFVTLLHIGWRKFGGLVSGGRYSDPHSWTELYSYLPEFVFLFVVVFVGIFVLESMKKKEVYLKCPKCGNVIATCENIENVCQECGSTLERLDGFYERHPETK